MVRAGRGAEHVDELIDDGYVGLGWGAGFGELPAEPTRE